MKRLLLLLLLLTSLIGVGQSPMFGVVASMGSSEMVPKYYFADDGNDANDGLTELTPKQSLTALNSLTLEPGDYVALKSGDSFEGTITLSQSGTVDNPIVYSSYGTGAKPKIYGSDIIEGGWTVHSGSIWKKTGVAAITQLFLNDERMQVARFPESGYALVTSAPTVSSLTYSGLNGALDYTGAKCLIHSGSYAFSTNTVTSSSSTTLQLNSTPFGNVNAGERFILVGKLEFLTKAGQWFYDAATTTLYVWTPNSDTPSNYTVRGSIRDYGVYADNKSNIKINGIEVLQQKTNGFNLAACSNITLTGNTITDQEGKGIAFTSGSTNNNIEYNIISGQNIFGIENYHTYGNITNNTVTSIANFDQLGLLGCGSWFAGSGIYSQGTGNNVEYNEVENVGYNGIHFNGGVQTIRYNHVSNCLTTKTDGGLIYTSAGENYQNETIKGSIIRYNTCENSTTAGNSIYGIYLDQWAGGIIVEYNNVSNISYGGIFLHDTNGCTVRYNTVLNSNGLHGMLIKSDGREDVITDNIVSSWESGNLITTGFLEAVPTINNNTYSYSGVDGRFRNNDSDYYTFATWKSTFGYDASSTLRGVVPTTNHTKVMIANTTNATKTYYLNTATSVINDITGVSITSDFTIPAYGSIIVSGLNVEAIQDYADIVAPVITAFSIPSTSTELEVPISTFTVTGNETHYLINESAATPLISASGWATVKPTSYSFVESGTKTLYAWAKDAAGNISSSVSASVTVTAASSLFANNILLFDYENSGTTLNDLSGNGLNGTNYTSTTITTGLPGNAYLYSYATNRYTSIADNVLLDFTGAYTISAWVNMTSLSSARAIMSKVDGSNKEFSLYIQADGSVKILSYENNTTYMVSAETPSGTIVTGSNYHVVVTMDDSKKVRTGLKIYVNEVEQTLTYAGNITDLTVGIVHTPAPLMIGQDPNQTLFFNGKISQIGLWVKTFVLSEINYLNNSEAGRARADW